MYSVFDVHLLFAKLVLHLLQPNNDFEVIQIYLDCNQSTFKLISQHHT